LLCMHALRDFSHCLQGPSARPQVTGLHSQELPSP
jgi:hypothetical protein